MAYTTGNLVDADLQSHYETYKSFTRYVLIFGLHVAVVLALLAFFLT